MIDVVLPALGENIESVTVARLLVKQGDTVRKDQPVCEVETEKASLEVPSPTDGVVGEIVVREGAKAKVGDVLLRIGGDAAAAASAPTPKQVAPAIEPAEPEVTSPTMPSRETKLAELGDPAPAAPSVRRLARELGLDIHEVPGSGPEGRISLEDVKAAARERMSARPAPGTRSVAAPPGEDRVVPMSGVRRATGAAMARAWSQIPAVTQFDHADVSEVERLRKDWGPQVERAGGKLTITAIAVRIVAAALRRFPSFNAQVDVENERIVHKGAVDVGVAVDTEHGLLVPVIRGADTKSIARIAAELGDLAARARARKLGLDEMSGATFTISNLGGLGTTYFTPIVPHPQVAILGIGRAETQAVWNGTQFEPRRILPLSVSYDHRAVDGADAARFVRFVAQALEQPLLLVLED